MPKSIFGHLFEFNLFQGYRGLNFLAFFFNLSAPLPGGCAGDAARPEAGRCVSCAQQKFHERKVEKLQGPKQPGTASSTTMPVGEVQQGWRV